MGKTINDILFSDMSHNSRVFKICNKLNDSQIRYRQVVIGNQIGRSFDITITLEKKNYYGLKRGFDINEEAIKEKKIEKKYDDYMEDLRKKRLKINRFK